MERRSGRRRSLELLAIATLLMALAGTCRRESPEKAYRAARADMDRNELSAASAKVDAALARFDDTDDEWVWALRIIRAEVLAKRGKGEEARALLRDPLPERYAHSEAAVRRLMVLGIAEAADRSAGPRRFAEAHALALRSQPQLLGDTHLGLAFFSDIDEAERHIHTAIDIARQQMKEIAVANAYSALSRGYAAAARYAEAIEAGEEALRSYERLGVHGRVSQAAGNLGWAYMEIGDHETAEELVGRAAQAAKAAGVDVEQMRWLNQLGNLKESRGDFAGADRDFVQALAIAEALGRREAGNGKAAQDPQLEKEKAHILSNRARVQLALGAVGVAAPLVARALEIKRAAETRESELISLVIEARIEEARGDVARAEQLLRDIASRTAMKATRWEAQARLAQLYARTRRGDLAAVEFRRAIETASEAREERAGDRDLRLPFFNLVAEIFDTYIDFLVDAGRIEEALAVTEMSRAQSLEEGLGIEAANGRLDARRVARRRGATILCYWLGRSRAYLWVVTPESVKLHPLPPSRTIEAEVESYRRATMRLTGTPERLADRGRALFTALVAPAGILPPNARVIIVPDGRLHELNFETLVADDRFWIEDAILSTASSLKLLVRQTPPRVRDASILLVGDVPEVDPAFPRLAHAGTEIAGIKRQFPRPIPQPVVLHGGAATPSRYAEIDPSRFELLHFVAHGVASRKRPLDSAVILARDPKGYKLFARDIVGLKPPLRARLVTISSCHGSGQRTYKGVGLVGLAWAFLAAGSENVIAALWDVNDTTTPKLMERLYARLRAGDDPAVALREAKLTLVRAKGNERKPYYWAPFVLYSGS